MKSKKFNFYAVMFCVLGIIYMFMFSGLQNDQINIIQAYSGWDSTMTSLPMTIGNVVCIVLTFIYGTLFIKFGVRKTVVPCIVLSAAGCLGIAAANGLRIANGSGNYVLFFISLFVVRCACMCMQMGAFMICSNWFIKYRGRVMGIITLGSPLFSVIGTSVMSKFISEKLGDDYRPFYIGIAIVLVAIAVLTVMFIYDNPEDIGLYPDGADAAPASEASNNDEVNLTVKEVLSMKKSWQLIVSYGAFYFVISACMGCMAVRFMSLGGLEVWLSATKWLALGAILGIPMSFIFGILDDKMGSINASIVLGLTMLIPVLCLWFMPMGGNTALEVLWGFGVACMTGGVPTMHPCTTAFCFGRREYQAANRIIMSIQLVPSAVAILVMCSLIEAGKANVAFAMLTTVVVIGIIAVFTMRGMKDANAADRAYN